ncbi:MAG: EAL domain-containing protein [Thiohalomonadales bacterium]
MKYYHSSIKSRLILLTIVISLVVFGLVLYAQNLNSVTSKRNITRTYVIQSISHSLAKINSLLQILEKEFYEQLINVDEDRVESIEQTYELLFSEIKIMVNNPDLNKIIFSTNKDSNFKNVKDINLLIQIDVQALKLPIDDFNRTAVDINKRYPAMVIIESTLLPLNQKIKTALDLAIIDLRKNNRKSNNSTKIERLFQNARYSWLQQTQYVRLFISNRSGIFGDEKKSVQQNLNNREIYYSKVLSILKELKKYDKKNELGLIQSESINDLKIYIKKYNSEFNRARDIHLSEDWRIDVKLLEYNIQPALDLIWEKLVNLQIMLGAQSNESIIISQNTSDKISNMIWYSLILIILVMVVIYFAFEVSLRRPIVKVAKALDSEAKGEVVSSIGEYYGTEINELLDAFSNMREQVRTRQERLQSILDNALEGIIITNEEGIIESFNNAAEDLFKFSADEVIGQDISILIPWTHSEAHKDKIKQYLTTGVTNFIGKNREVEAVKKDSNVFPVSVKVNEMIIDGERYFTAVVEDISERKALIEDLEYQANHDSLTGLYNRNYFTNALEQTVNQHIRGDSNNNAIIYLDLDNFKYVNDTMGHLAGDQLIKEVSTLLQNRIRKTDILGRIGGDEFAILLYHEKNVHLEYVAECFRKILSSYIFKYEGNIVDITCSLGGAYIDKDIKTKEHLLARADFACHEAKRLGRNQVYIYSKEDDKHVSDMSRDIGWTRRIKEALVTNNFLLACQPIYNTRKNVVSYYEILIRMTDSDGKIIMPFGFISAAERFGLMLEIDAWVLRNSLKLISEQHKFNPELKLSINLSAHSIDNDTTYDLIKNEIESHNIDPKKLLFEVTETIAIANMNTANNLLKNIQTLGCKTALDDFGVGHSSFAYLVDLPVDIVKIDGFFVKDMTTKSLNKTMVRAINDIAHELGKTTVAEFVESEEIYQALKDIGVDYSQGYHLGKPEIIYDFTKNIEDLFNTPEDKINIK